jgi:hypothetical protein
LSISKAASMVRENRFSMGSILKFLYKGLNAIGIKIILR